MQTAGLPFSKTSRTFIMNNLIKTLSIPALVIFASASQAALYDVSIDISGDISGNTTGTISGAATGTYDNISGDLVFTGSLETVIPAFNMDTIFGTEGTINGTSGSVVYTSCDPNGGNNFCGLTTLNSPLDVAFNSNTVDATGNGVITSVLSNGNSTSNITFSVSAAPVSSVPVPAAAWLFGSALLGLGGVRRSTRRG